MEQNPILVLFHLGGHFEQREEDRGRLGLGQRGLLQRLGAEGMVEDIGGTRQQEPRGIGQEGRR